MLCYHIVWYLICKKRFKLPKSLFTKKSKSTTWYFVIIPKEKKKLQRWYNNKKVLKVHLAAVPVLSTIWNSIHQLIEFTHLSKNCRCWKISRIWGLKSWGWKFILDLDKTISPQGPFSSCCGAFCHMKQHSSANSLNYWRTVDVQTFLFTDLRT